VENAVVINSDWVLPRTTPELGRSEVHAWIADLNIGSAEISRVQELLSAEERERAARFRIEKPRIEYAAARGFLRTILGGYLKRHPSELKFRYNNFGKPFLADEFAASKLQFNLAHSHGLALYSVTLDSEIGVDIERVRPEVATTELAQRFFAPEEVKVLMDLPPADRTRGFFECWTCKEAVLKARGSGLALPLDDFVVAFGPNATPGLLSAKDDPQAAGRWIIRRLFPADGYAGSLAMQAREIELRLWRFDSGALRT